MRLSIALALVVGAGLCPIAAQQPARQVGIYQVVLPKGDIRHLPTGAKLQAESKFSTRDRLRFQSAGDYLVVVDEYRSALLLRPTQKLDAYTAQPIRARINTRSGKILNYLTFVRCLEGPAMLGLGGQAALEISREAFPMDEHRFFYVQYNWSGSPEPIHKKLSFEGEWLFFNQDELYAVDGQPIAPQEVQGYVLYYYDEEAQLSTRINAFDLAFPDEAELKRAIGVLIQNYGPSPDEEAKAALVSTIKDFLYWEYGASEEHRLMSWLAEAFGI